MMSVMERPLNDLRREIVSKYPNLNPGTRHPAQALWFPFLVGSIFEISAHLAGQPRFSAGNLFFSLGLGLLYGSLGLFTHELLHGSILRIDKSFTGLAVRIMAWFGFLILGVSPHLWMVWHNKTHHYNTNVSAVDPDSFGFWSDFKKFPMTDMVLKRAPGSGHWLSWIYFPLNFSNQAVNVIWYFVCSIDAKTFSSLNKKVAIVETLGMYGFWAWVGFHFGMTSFTLIFLFPVLVVNLVVSGYILVQHLLCPLTQINDPFENTLGVETLAGLDWIHFHFSHHIEHHLFPEMSHVRFSELREFLKKEYPARYRCMSHWKAIRLLLSTPRVYLDSTTLFDPQGDRVFDVSNIGRVSR